MSVRLPAADIIDNDDDSRASSSTDDNDEEETWEDWVSDSGEKIACRSLFEDKTFASAKESLEYDATAHGFNLDQTCVKLGQSMAPSPGKDALSK
jgi:protein arginine N-methyltransferase 3